MSGRTDHDQPSILPLPAHAPLRIIVEPGEPPPATAEVHAEWNTLRATLPRLFNGPILSVIEVDAARGTIRCRRDTYQRLVVQGAQHALDTGVRQLAITGVLVARDEGGQKRVLLGQRSCETRMYPGMWELAPAGGIEPPRGAGRDELDHPAIMEHLAREAMEELGVDLRPAVELAAPLAVIFDPFAHSYDIVVAIHLDAMPSTMDANWEYQNIRWIPADETADAANASDIIPPSQALLRWLAGRA